MDKRDWRLYEPLIRSEIKALCENGRFLDTISYVQHGDISVFEHCIAVAYMSARIARRLNLKVDKRTLVRGALLHDYFLYDWHEKDKSHSLHGFRHPRKAMENASQDFVLTEREKNIILRHMFPLTVIPPTCVEAWVVCLADKICASTETVHLSKREYKNYIRWILDESTK